MDRWITVVRAILSVLIILGPGASSVAAAPLSPGDILVADQGGTIQHFTAAGVGLGAFASGLASPSWITTDPSGNIYVSEYTGGKVVKLSPSGVNLLTITVPFSPGGVAVGSDGTIYVGDYFGADVYRYSPSDGSLGLFASPPLARVDFMAFDGNGILYVTDFTNGVIRRISPTPVDLGTFATHGGAEGIAFDASGNLYVSSFSANIIDKFSPSGTHLGTFASIGSGSAYGIAFDSAGNLYVANYAGGHIHKFSASGQDLGIFASTGLIFPRDLVVVPGPVTKDQCENGGWETYEFPRPFRNQGDCIQFVETGK